MTAKALRQREGNRGEAVPSHQNGFTRTRPQGFKVSKQLLSSGIAEEVAVIKPEVSKGRHSEGSCTLRNEFALEHQKRSAKSTCGGMNCEMRVVRCAKTGEQRHSERAGGSKADSLVAGGQFSASFPPMSLLSSCLMKVPIQSDHRVQNPWRRAGTGSWPGSTRRTRRRSPSDADLAINVSVLVGTDYAYVPCDYWTWWGIPSVSCDLPWTWVAYRVGTLLIEMGNLGGRQPGPPPVVPRVWAGAGYSVLTPANAQNIQIAVGAVDQAFAQSPYLVTP